MFEADDIIMQKAMRSLEELSQDEEVVRMARRREQVLKQRDQELEDIKNQAIIQGRIEGWIEGKIDGNMECIRALMRTAGLNAKQAMNMINIPMTAQNIYMNLLECAEGATTA